MDARQEARDRLTRRDMAGRPPFDAGHVQALATLAVADELAALRESIESFGIAWHRGDGELGGRTVQANAAITSGYDQ